MFLLINMFVKNYTLEFLVHDPIHIFKPWTVKKYPKISLFLTVRAFEGLYTTHLLESDTPVQNYLAPP